MKSTVQIAQKAARVRMAVPLGTLDAIVCASAYLFTLLLRFDGNVSSVYWNRFLLFVPFIVGVHCVANWAWGLYGQMWRHASVNEARRVLLAGGTSLLVLTLTSMVIPRRLPLSVLVTGAIISTLVFGALRFQSRLFAFRRSGERNVGVPTIVIGAGAAAAAIIREMMRTPTAGLRPVALLDDDPRKQGLSLLSVPVVGAVSSLGEAVAAYDAEQVLLAIPSADQALVKRVAAAAEESGVAMKVLPPAEDLLGHATVRDVRDLQIDDLLGRSQVTTDLDAVTGLLSGRRVLITGGGGSIGSEIARQVAECRPAELIVVDHDETHLHDAVGVLDFPATSVLADIRDRDRIDQLFQLHRPEIVFHAAAHKHVPILERHPCEGIRTNVLGTENVIRAAAAVGTERFVFISSDKAVSPSSVMGATKWVGEQLVLSRAEEGRAWCAVRFGNVLGSRGSVIPTFTRQIAAGGPVTVTHEEMTRFFMSVREAVQLVLQASVFARGAEVFMLEMGEPVNIYSLAKRMIRLSGRLEGRDIEIKITGVRDGEKLAEELRTSEEEPHVTPHPSIVCLYPVRNLDHGLADDLLEVLTLADQANDVGAARTLLDMTTRTYDVRGHTFSDVDLLADQATSAEVAHR